ncbi:33330_t:CDS:2, partial [Gigaspora margarita]
MTEADSNIGLAHQNLQENDNKIASLIESIKKLSISFNEKDKSSPNNEASTKAYIIDNTISDIVKQVL